MKDLVESEEEPAKGRIASLLNPDRLLCGKNPIISPSNFDTISYSLSSRALPLFLQDFLIWRLIAEVGLILAPNCWPLQDG